MKRVKNIENLDTIYIGIESVNELFDYYFASEQSTFEIKTQFVKSSHASTMDSYVFEQGLKDIKVLINPTDPEHVKITWSPIYHRTEDAQRMVQFVPVEDVTYQLYFGQVESTAYQMRARCQLDNADKHMITPVLLSDKHINDHSITLTRS